MTVVCRNFLKVSEIYKYYDKKNGLLASFGMTNYELNKFCKC